MWCGAETGALQRYVVEDRCSAVVPSGCDRIYGDYATDHRTEAWDRAVIRKFGSLNWTDHYPYALEPLRSRLRMDTMISFCSIVRSDKLVVRSEKAALRVVATYCNEVYPDKWVISSVLVISEEEAITVAIDANDLTPERGK